jgi:hypothetical protein
MRKITATGQVTLSGSPSVILDVNIPASGVVIKNAGTVNVYIGNADVTASTGHLIEPHEAITVPVQAAVYGVTAGAAGLVTYLQIQ